MYKLMYEEMSHRHPTRNATSPNTHPPQQSRISASEALAALKAGPACGKILERALQLKGDEQEELFHLARQSRERCFPDRKVEVRSVIEISNICRQGCRFCNMGRGRAREPYVIGLPVLLDLVTHVYEKGRRVLLIQSGENPAKYFVEHVAHCIKGIRERFPDMTLILCLGNLSLGQYRQLKEAGADRYILKFETSSAALYRTLKPLDTLERRLACLEDLLTAGFQVGTGNIVGLPGQTLTDIAEDILLLGKYPLAMASCTVFIPAEESELRGEPIGDLDLTLNAMALIRILNPDRLMPTTSSLDKAHPGGQLMGLMAGANTVTIHDGTPESLKALFPIYSTSRYTPNIDHMRSIVEKAGLCMA